MSSPTQAPYEIAKYLSDEAKRAAVARRYVARTYCTNVLASHPRCASGMCPLGVAVAVMFGSGNKQPGPRTMMALLGQPAALEAAETFIRDWETGRIDDLAAAWGVAS
jgi:hypothetical protein